MYECPDRGVSYNRRRYAVRRNTRYFGGAARQGILCKIRFGAEGDSVYDIQ